jgi:hypothetical protein
MLQTYIYIKYLSNVMSRRFIRACMSGEGISFPESETTRIILQHISHKTYSEHGPLICDFMHMFLRLCHAQDVFKWFKMRPFQRYV